MIPVKVCGITNLTDALTCLSHGVSALGFVFADSKRRVTVEQAYRISRQLSPWVIKVGVFVDEDPFRIREILKDCRLDLAQLHGRETPDDCELLEGRAIKAFRAGYDHPDFKWKGAAIRGVLVDSYSAGTKGGTGVVFDWELAPGFRDLGFPLILAGGLNPDNVTEAIRAVKPDGVDVSSGVERELGLKDSGKIAKLMDRIRVYSGQEPGARSQ